MYMSLVVRKTPPENSMMLQVSRTIAADSTLLELMHVDQLPMRLYTLQLLNCFIQVESTLAKW